MDKMKKPDQNKPQPSTTLTDTDETFAGDENRTIMPKTPHLVTPDPSNVPEGQTTKM